MDNNVLNRLKNGDKLSIDDINNLLPCTFVSKAAKANTFPENNVKNILTSREYDIVKLISEGFKNKEISASLLISYETVKTHRKNIFRKLDINNVSQLLTKMHTDNDY